MRGLSMRLCTTVLSTALLAAALSGCAAGTSQASTGRFLTEFGPAASPAAERGKQLAVRHHTLEGFAQEADNFFLLPQDVPIVGRQCDEANAYWDPQAGQIQFCYEMLDHIDEFAAAHSGGSEAERTRLFTAVSSMIFYHETGHMAISLYSLPATGREEDSADQLATLVLLSTPDHSGGADAVAAAEFWRSSAGDPADLDSRRFGDSHSLDEVRGFNLLCWVYGSDPSAYPAIVAPAGPLPSERASGCPLEYQKMKEAWNTLLAPHVKGEIGGPAD
ncbi:DUF4344 domain-containing metallopeptidase [Nocardia sp. NPDC050712]|uniref:DUF4344 domain-containing metallopeptidase n=1 Tax=Nocardia sp. NPDC050712 TaxID=3155518 RepID=UPI0033E23593